MKPGGANEEPIVSDLTFVVEFAGSIAVVALPIVVLLRLVAANGASGITDLFMVTGRFDIGAGSPEEETPPRWHPERLTPPRPAATSSEDSASLHATVGAEELFMHTPSWSAREGVRARRAGRQVSRPQQ